MSFNKNLTCSYFRIYIYIYISDEFVSSLCYLILSTFQLSHGPDQWVNEFTTEREQHGSVDDQWVNEFSKLQVHDWAEEFGHQVGEGALGENSADNWANAYDE